MPAKLFITIDTEEDLWDNWKRRDNPVENISRIPLLQDLFDHYGAIPTYLVNYPVITNKYSSRIMRKIYDKGSCEIGTHIHPWNTPPFEETICAENSFICNLPQELAKRKLLNLHNEITDNIGMEPKCFRAGRWGFGPAIASCINELGYLIDTSITPFCNWTEEEGPDFTDASYLPYRFEPHDVLSKNSDGRLLEIPPTIGFFQQNFDLCLKARKWILGSRLSRRYLIRILDRLRIINFRLLSPEMSSGSEMIRLAKSFIKNGYPFLNMFFHSTSLLPGESPFIKNDQELERFLKNIEMFLKFAIDQGLVFSSLKAASEDISFSSRRMA